METKTQMVEKQIKITWVGMFDKSKFAQVGFTWQVGNEMSDREILNKIYQDTNLYSGIIWELIEEILPPNRPHTALSVGDWVVIDGKTYECDDFGWKELGA